VRIPDACQDDLAAVIGTSAIALAFPEPPPGDRPWLAQSLSEGAAGIALLHIERAHAGHGTWRRAHSWISSAVSGEVSASDTSGLFLGLPAVAFMLDAAALGTTRYQAGLTGIDRHLATLACRRAEVGMTRIRAGRLPGFHEYDVFFGLTGIGAVLLRRDPGGTALEHVLRYLVALTRPLRAAGQKVPGWWCGHDPHRRQSPDYPGGHGNFGAAHGIAGPLALLGHAARREITVDGQPEAIRIICAWLDAWRQESPVGPWWPEWITLADLRAGRPGQRTANRPSWCYGTPGIARAGQVASIAIGDESARRHYEQALVRCLQDAGQRVRMTDAGLCHGAAGLYMTARRAAEDAHCPALTAQLPGLAADLHRQALAGTAHGRGLLDGVAGTALALHAAVADTAPISGWDACLLIS
jgi:lantibiotic biosynthesis protein